MRGYNATRYRSTGMAPRDLTWKNMVSRAEATLRTVESNKDQTQVESGGPIEDVSTRSFARSEKVIYLDGQRMDWCGCSKIISVWATTGMTVHTYIHTLFDK